jgi:hypothetical protein
MPPAASAAAHIAATAAVSLRRQPADGIPRPREGTVRKAHLVLKDGLVSTSAAQADAFYIEDQRAEARQRAEFNKWQLERSADASFDDTAVQAEKATRAEHAAEWGPKVAEKRARERETRDLIRADHRLRQMGFRGV